jgi:hypothetical protein
VFFAIGCGALYLTWRWLHTSLWWIIVPALAGVWCAWDARPPRRRRHLSRTHGAPGGGTKP